MFNPQSSQPTSRLPGGNSDFQRYPLGPIELRPIATLVDYENNPRKHPERQIAKLMQSIQEFGFTMPVLVDSRGIIIAGQARVEAARRLQMVELPVLVADRWSDKQVRAYRLADNRLAELGLWNLDALSVEVSAIAEFEHSPIELLGWEACEIVPVRPHGPIKPRVKRSAQYRSKLARVSIEGDLWHLDGHRLLCGSSRNKGNWDKLLGGTPASLAFTRVPVGGLGDHIDMHAKALAAVARFPGTLKPPSCSPALIAAIEVLPSLLKPGGILMVAGDWRHGAELAQMIEATSLSLVHMCVRTKPAGEQGELYRSAHDLIWIARKLEGIDGNLSPLGHERQSRTDVWDYPHDGSDALCGSRIAMATPDQLPVSLIEDAITDVTRTGEIVIDPFVGSGNTILAAERTGRRLCGVECDPLLADATIRRWEALTGSRAVHAQSGETFAVIGSQRNELA